MIVIQNVSNQAQADASRELLKEYALFLRGTHACGGFDFAQFTQEIAAIPMPYTAWQGEFLLLTVADEPAGCIAFRRASPSAILAVDQVSSCEIKRLFVRPVLRSHGYARQLITAALSHAKQAGFTRAILDTDLSTMAEAHRLYLSLGFAEYHPRDGDLAFLQRGLH